MRDNPDHIVRMAARICNGEPGQKAVILEYLGIHQESWLVIHNSRRLPTAVEEAQAAAWEQEQQALLAQRGRRRGVVRRRAYHYQSRASKPLIDTTILKSEEAAWLIAQHKAAESAQYLNPASLEAMDPEKAVERFNQREWDQHITVQRITLY